MSLAVRAASVGGDADNWLGDCAWAVGDCQSSSRSHGVGNIVMGDNSRLRAVGGVGSDDLSDIRGVAVTAVAGRDTSGQRERSSGNGGETHCGFGIRYLRLARREGWKERGRRKLGWMDWIVLLKRV